MFWGISIGGAFQGVLRVGWPRTHFFFAPSPLFLLFKLVIVSILVSEVSILVEAVLVLDFFLAVALDTGITRCSVMLAGMGAVTDVGIKTGVGADVDAFLAGEAVVDLFSAFLEVFFFFPITSVHPSSVFLDWA